MSERAGGQDGTVSQEPNMSHAIAWLWRRGTGLLQKLAHIRRATSRLCYDTEPAEMALLPGRKTQVGKADLPSTSILIPLCFRMWYLIWSVA